MAPLRVHIQTLREAKGWTQGELAEKAGVTRATVNRIEKARTKAVDLDVLEKLARTLGVAPGMLIAEAEAPPTRRKR